LAWDRLKDVVNGPVEITNAEVVCDRLNKAAPAADLLPQDAFYSAAGFEGDGILDTIHAEMARRFPNHLKYDLPPLHDDDAIHAFGYLEAQVRYKWPYLVNPKSFHFADSKGGGRQVNSFGLPIEAGDNATQEMRDQAGILFVEYEEMRSTERAFAIDLDRHSAPIQAVLARVDRKATLQEILAESTEHTRAFDAKADHVHWEKELGVNDTLVVPEMRWKVRHQFHELAGPGKNLKFQGRYMPVVRAEQIMSFHLDSRGAGVASSGTIQVKSGPRHFHFDRPFLLYLKKRDAESPFFVMWVENTELLCAQ
jgi:hypothetical protein